MYGIKATKKLVCRTVSDVQGNMVALQILSLLALIGLGSAAHLNFGRFSDVLALSGFSLVEYLNSHTDAGNFSLNYPSGASQQGGVTLVTMLSPRLLAFGFEPDIVFAILVALEVACLVVGSFILFRALLGVAGRSDDNHNPRLAAVSCISFSAILVLSWARLGNVSHFGVPFLHGQFYGFADGLVFAAIGCVLRRHIALAAGLALVAFAIHPVKAGLGGVALAAMVLTDARMRKSVRIWAIGVFGAVAACFWAYFVLDIVKTGAPSSDAIDWVFHTKLLNYHWYPLHIGLFSHLAHSNLIPFLGSVLIAAYSVQSVENAQIRSQLVAALSVLLALTAVGLVFGSLEAPFVIVKLALHRASELFMALAVFLTIYRLKYLVEQQSFYQAAVMVALVVGWWRPETAWGPILVCAAFFSSNIWLSASLWGKAMRGVAILYLATLGIVAFAGFDVTRSFDQQITILIFTVSFALVAMFLSRHPRFQFLSVHRGNIGVALSLSALLMLCLNWSISYKKLDDGYLERAEHYRDVQSWASDNTGKTDVFQVDPCFGHGWREFSKRSSFGTIEEWMKTSFLYLSDVEQLHEGVNRARLFDIDLDEMRQAQELNFVWDASSNMCKRARNVYYQMRQPLVHKLRSEYCVRYLVFDNILLASQGPEHPQLNVVFENVHFSVFETQSMSNDDLPSASFQGCLSLR